MSDDELIVTAFVHYLLSIYPVLYCGVFRAGRLTLMLIKCVYPCWLLIGAGVVSRCWRLLLCIAAPRLPVDTLFPVTWGLSLAGEPVEAVLGEEMTRWFEIAANPMPALLPDQTGTGHVCCCLVSLCSLTEFNFYPLQGQKPSTSG